MRSAFAKVATSLRFFFEIDRQVTNEIAYFYSFAVWTTGREKFKWNPCPANGLGPFWMSMQDFNSLIRFETQQSQHIQKVSQRDPSGEYHGACTSFAWIISEVPCQQNPDPLHQNYLVCFPRFQCQGALFNPFVNQRTIGIEKLSCSFGGIEVLLLGSIGETAIYAAVAFRCNHQWFNINRNQFLSWQLGGLSTTPNLCSHKLQHHEGSQHPCAWKSHKRFKHRGIDGSGTCPCSGGLGWNQIDFNDDSEGRFQGDFFLNALVPPIWKGAFLGRTKLDPPSTATPHRSRHATRHAGGGGGGQSMTWEELCDDDVDVWFAHASHSWFMKLLGSPCDQTAYVMKRCSLGCIHLDSDSQLLRGPWGGVGEGRVSRHHVFLVSGVACQNASSCFIYLFHSFLICWLVFQRESLCTTLPLLCLAQ